MSLFRRYLPVLVCGLVLSGTGLAATPLDQVPNGRGVRFSGTGSDQFGAAVAGLGDLNNDGFSDLAVGAPATNRTGASAVGAVHVFFGSTSPVNLATTALNGSNGFTLTASTLPANSGLGLEVAAAGDLNDDGVNDLVVGSNANIAPQSSVNAVWVLFGRTTPFPAIVDVSSLSGSTGFAIAAEFSTDQLGQPRTLGGEGDFNGDQITDLVLGAPGRASGGRAYLLLGRSTAFPAALSLTTLTATTGAVLSTATGGTLGESVAIGARINNDELAELVVGNRNGANTAGVAYTVYGRGTPLNPVSVDGLDGVSGFAVVGEATGALGGRALSLPGDIDGDGPDDLAIGAPGASGNNGAVYLVYGNFAGLESAFSASTLDGSNGFILTGASGEQLGGEVARIGDRNSDALLDIAVLAAAADPNGVSNAGRVYVRYGAAAPTAASVTAASLDNPTRGEVYDGVRSNGGNMDLAGIGKFDADQRSDLAVGVPAGSEVFVILRAQGEQVFRNGFE